MPLTNRSWIGVVVLALHLASVGAFGDESVRVWQENVRIPTYPVGAEDPHPHYYEHEGALYYPYSAQDRLSSQREERTYRAWFVENETIKLMCLPEIGGRIQYVYDKRRDEPMFYHNRVIRPGMIALRGAWVSGGIEWNRGPQGHTVTSFSPVDVTGVQNSDGSATLVIGNTEMVHRTSWEVRLSLHPGKTFIEEHVTLFNATDGTHPYYFWNNTAFPNRPGTRFMFPMSVGTDHDGLNFFNWPTHEGTDLTRLVNYAGPTSIFAYRSVFDFFGAYDVDRDFGIVQVADHRLLPGKKAWTWGQADSGLVSQSVLTDEDGPYIEVQSGPLPTQADFGTLEPGASISWRELWYPVFGLEDGYEYATEFAAIQRDSSTEGALGFRMMATERKSGVEWTIRRASSDGQPGEILAARTLDIPIDRSVMLAVDGVSADRETPVDVRLVDSSGTTLLAYRSPLMIPREEIPDLDALEPQLDQSSASDWFRRGRLADLQMNRADASLAFTRSLELDASHDQARLAVASIAFESGRDDRAWTMIRPLLHDSNREAANWRPWHLAGVLSLRASDWRAAEVYGFEVVKRGAPGLGYGIVGRSLVAQQKPAQARKHLAGAIDSGGDRVRLQELLWVATLVAGDEPSVNRQTTTAIRRGTIRLMPYALQALTAASWQSSKPAYVDSVLQFVGEDAFSLLELGLRFAEVGEFDLAVEVTDVGDLPEQGAVLLDLYRAYWSAQAGRDSEALRLIRRLATRPMHGVFPSRPEAIKVLDWLSKRNPSERGWVSLLRGNLMAGLGRFDEANAAWWAAVAHDPGLGLAWRNLGVDEWRRRGRLEAAVRAYEQALARRPDDQTLVRDLAAVRVAQSLPGIAVEILESVEASHRRADVTLELARAYVSVGRVDDAIDLLANTTFSNREGDQGTWRVFSDAHIRRGRRFFDRAQWEQALADFDTALTFPIHLNVGRPHQPREARGLYWRGRALAQLGNDAQAAESWQRCITMMPVDDEAQSFIARCRQALRD